MSSQMESEQPSQAVPQLETARDNNPPPGITETDATFAEETLKGKVQSKAESLRLRLLGIINRFESKLKELNFSQYCYFFACLMLIAFLSDDVPGENYQLVVGVIAGLGLLRELWIVFNKTWDHTLGKALLLVLYAATANFALAISALKINSIAGVEPQIFIFTMGFTTLLMLPFWLLGASLVFLGSAILVINIWLLASVVLRIFRVKVKMHWEDKSFAVLTMLMRLLLIPFLMTALAHLINPYLKQMDMLDHFEEATLIEKIDPRIVDPALFAGSSEEEVNEFLAMVREADLENLSDEEVAAIQLYGLNEFQLGVLRELPDSGLNRLKDRIKQKPWENNEITVRTSLLPNPEFTISGGEQSPPESSMADTLRSETTSSEATNSESATTETSDDSELEVNLGFGEEGEDLPYLNLMVANFLYLFETYRYTACAKEPHQRGLQLDENMLFIAERDASTELGFRFSVRKCVPDESTR